MHWSNIIAADRLILTTYERLTPDARAARPKASKKATAKRLHEKTDDDDGPPDKRSNFGKHGQRTWHRASI